MRKNGKRPRPQERIDLQERQERRLPRKRLPRRSKELDIRDHFVTSIAIEGLDSHELEALQLELRALASSCGLEVTALEVKAAKRD